MTKRQVTVVGVVTHSKGEDEVEVKFKTTLSELSGRFKQLVRRKLIRKAKRTERYKNVDVKSYEVT